MDRPADANGAGAQNTPPNVAFMREAIVEKLKYAVGKNPMVSSAHDWFVATALAVRDEIVDHWIDSTTKTYRTDEKRVY
mgnify:CR=1 FL=1